MKKIMIMMVLVFVALGLTAGPGFSAAADTAGKATEKAKAAPAEKAKAVPKPLKSPVIKLDRVEIANYWGYIDPATKCTSPLVLAFVFALKNPNNVKVMLDDLKFTVAFEDFEVNTVMYYDDNYIPGGATDYLRINVVLDSGVTNGLLLVTSGHRLVEMNVKSTDLLEKWWKGVSDFNFPISVRNGTATFIGPGDKSMRVFFEGVFPQK